MLKKHIKLRGGPLSPTMSEDIRNSQLPNNAINSNNGLHNDNDDQLFYDAHESHQPGHPDVKPINLKPDEGYHSDPN